MNRRSNRRRRSEKRRLSPRQFRLAHLSGEIRSPAKPPPRHLAEHHEKEKKVRSFVFRYRRVFIRGEAKLTLLREIERERGREKSLELFLF